MGNGSKGVNVLDPRSGSNRIYGVDPGNGSSRDRWSGFWELFREGRIHRVDPEMDGDLETLDQMIWGLVYELLVTYLGSWSV